MIKTKISDQCCSKHDHPGQLLMLCQLFALNTGETPAGTVQTPLDVGLPLSTTHWGKPRVH